MVARFDSSAKLWGVPLPVSGSSRLLEDLALHSLNQGGFVLHPRRGWRVGAVAQDEPGPRGDFLLQQFGQPRVLTLQALEEKQERLVPALLQPVADFPDWLEVLVRV